MQEIWVDSDTAAPEPVGRRWRWQFFFLGVFELHVVVRGIDVIVACQAHWDRDDRLEALGCVEVRDGLALDFGWWIEHEHAEADEGMAEEDRDSEKDQDEEDVDLLTYVFVCQSDAKV